jgi:hypothetical protein
MNRNPPAEVRKILRDEVVFGCPYPGCGSPYLTWHHFDPPWHIENHHRPEGMIALCREHHDQADSGAFTIEQLHKLKRDGRSNWTQVKGKFNWMRNRLLAVVGGNFYLQPHIILRYKGANIIWFERSEDGYILLNLRMLTASERPRAWIQNNEWFNTGYEEDVDVPPSGKRLRISYENGDSVSVEFFECLSRNELANIYKTSPVERWPIDFPITVVEVTNTIAGSNLNFKAKETTMLGGGVRNCFATNISIVFEITE